MCAYAEKVSRFPRCDSPTSFSREQVAFLEDLLINQGCMRALERGRSSSEPERCRKCAVNIARMVDLIRQMRTE